MMHTYAHVAFAQVGAVCSCQLMSQSAATTAILHAVCSNHSTSSPLSEDWSSELACAAFLLWVIGMPSMTMARCLFLSLSGLRGGLGDRSSPCCTPAAARSSSAACLDILSRVRGAPRAFNVRNTVCLLRATVCGCWRGTAEALAGSCGDPGCSLAALPRSGLLSCCSAGPLSRR